MTAFQALNLMKGERDPGLRNRARKIGGVADRGCRRAAYFSCFSWSLRAGEGVSRAAPKVTVDCPLNSRQRSSVRAHMLKLPALSDASSSECSGSRNSESL